MMITTLRLRATEALTPKAVVLLLVGMFLFSLVLFPSWTVDDAYISLRYARNLAESGQLTWNIGDNPPVEGYTGLLWTLLAAAAFSWHLPALILLKIIGIACTLAMLPLVDLILIELGANQQRRMVALGLLVVAPWWQVHAASGLETPLFTLLILVCVLLALRRSALLPAACLLCALTRPEGAALAVALAIASWCRGDRRPWPYWLFFGGLGLTYIAWRLNYYGEMLPNTYYAKNSGESSWLHLVAFIAQCVFLPALAWWHSRPQGDALRSVRGLVVAMVTFCVVLLLVYGRSELLMNYSHRFFVPLLPVIIIGIAATWGHVRWSFLLVSYGWICALTLIGNGIWCQNYETMERSEHMPAAAWIADHIPARATLAVVVDAGIVPYQTGLRTIDMGALNDLYLARIRNPQARLNYFFSQKPDVVLLATGDLGIVSAEQFRSALLVDPRWRFGYHLEEEFKGPQHFEYHQQVWARNP